MAWTKGVEGVKTFWRALVLLVEQRRENPIPYLNVLLFAHFPFMFTAFHLLLQLTPFLNLFFPCFSIPASSPALVLALYTVILDLFSATLCLSFTRYVVSFAARFSSILKTLDTNFE